MSVLSNLESKLSSLIEGTFSRVFRSEVRPVEIARKLAREMEDHKAHTVARTYAPNEYRVFLSPRDRERFADYEEALADELAGYLLEHARQERLTLLSAPLIEFETDTRLGLGEFGIQTRVVSPAPDAARGQRRDRPSPDAEVARSPGRTMVYSSAGRVAEPLAERARARGRGALLVIDGQRVMIGPEGARIGRSRRCEVVLRDPNVSREHAEIRPRGGSWVLSDLQSTNGTLLNGRRLEHPEVIRPGDEIELGTSVAVFELQ